MIIYSKDGLTQRCEVKKFTYNGTFLEQSYITTTITSEAPIQFSVGDYCEYRGERFELNYIPSKEKVSSTNTYGEGYIYEDVKFLFLGAELSNCSFLDYVPYDNQTHYTGLPDFSFVGTVYNLVERIKANLDRIYKTDLSGTMSTTSGSALVSGTSTTFLSELNVGDRIRIGTQYRIVDSIASDTSLTVTVAFTENQTSVNGTVYLWDISVSDGYVSSEQSVTVNNINCFDALALANTMFSANYIIRNRTIRVGTSGIDVATVFGYGKGNGLKSIRQTTNNDSGIITRLRVFGSTKNIPYRWYNNQINPSTNLPYIQDSMYVPNLVLPNFLSNGGDSYIDATADVSSYNGGISSTNSFTYTFDGDDVDPTPITETLNAGDADDIVSYVDLYGVREGIVFFDGSDDREEIYPSIQGMTYAQLVAAGVAITQEVGDNGNLDEIYSVINPTDNGILPEDGTELEKTFTIVLKDLGFDLSEKLSDGSYKYASSDGEMTISMKSGNCVGREFSIVDGGIKKVTTSGVVTYELVCNREQDDAIGMAFPNSNYRVLEGDKFVIVNIQMPDAYVYAAMQRLLAAGSEYLDANNTTKFIYEPDIDNIYMARNPSIGLSLKEGDIFNFEDLDLPISDSVIIKTLEIVEGSSLIPEYSITLSNETTATGLTKVRNDVASIKNAISEVENIKQGAQGDVGAVLAYRGEYSGTKVYHGGRTYRDAVIYNGVYYVARTDAGSFSNRVPTDVSRWVIFGTQLESVATNLLLAQSAYINNLIVGRLGTTANPYANRLANIGSGIGVFRNLEDESSIDNAIIGMGKDISIAQQVGDRKPALVVRDKQWRFTYSPSTIYYKDDRVYYSSHLGAATWSSSTSYNIGTYVTYNNTVWVCTTNNSGYKPYVGSPYWNADGETYIFTKNWLETDTPSAGYLPTNYSYWRYLGSGNLDGGSYSEFGCEGVFSNGSNMKGFEASVGLKANVSAVFLLQKRNSNSNGISAAVLGMDQTDEANGPSKSYGGYFNSAYIGRVVHNIRTVSASGAILKSDYRIHCYGSSSITLSLPTPDNSMIGQTIKIRRLGPDNVTIITSSSYPIWDTSSRLSINFSNDDGLSFTWDGAYWVTEFTNQ